MTEKPVFEPKIFENEPSGVLLGRKTLGRIAWEAGVKHKTTPFPWEAVPRLHAAYEASALSVKKAVLEEAIEALSQKKNEYEMNEGSTKSHESMRLWEGASFAIDEALMILQRLLEKEG